MRVVLLMVIGWATVIRFCDTVGPIEFMRHRQWCSVSEGLTVYSVRFYSLLLFAQLHQLYDAGSSFNVNIAAARWVKFDHNVTKEESHA